MFNLHNKTAIVTGASRGIGECIAKTLANEGCNLILISRSIDSLNEVKNTINNSSNVNVDCFACDISNYKNVESVFSEITSTFDKVDILINNAGITRDNIILRMTEEDWDNVLDTNLKGYFNCCKFIIKHMIKRKQGKIVNISSIIGQKGNAGQNNYSASKAGIIGLTKSLAKEVGSRNININAIAPGYIETDMTKKLNDNQKNSFLEQISLRRFGACEEVANLVCFLSSDFANYITGETINIDGGLN